MQACFFVIVFLQVEERCCQGLPILCHVVFAFLCWCIIHDCLARPHFIHPLVLGWVFWFFRTVVNMLLWRYLCGFLLGFSYLFYLVEFGWHVLSLAVSGLQFLHILTSSSLVLGEPGSLSIRCFTWLASAYSRDSVGRQLSLDGISWEGPALTESFYIENRKRYFYHIPLETSRYWSWAWLESLQKNCTG